MNSDSKKEPGTNESLERSETAQGNVAHESEPLAVR